MLKLSKKTLNNYPNRVLSRRCRAIIILSSLRKVKEDQKSVTPKDRNISPLYFLSLLFCEFLYGRDENEDKEEEEMLKNPLKNMYFTRWVSDLDWRFLLLIIPPLSLLLFLSISAATNTTTFNQFSSFAPLRSFFSNRSSQHPDTVTTHNLSPSRAPSARESQETRWLSNRRKRKEELDRSRIAVCLVGGARRFELTGPSIVEKILKEYPNSDLFLNSPLDGSAFKFSLLKVAPRLASIRIFQPKPIPETETEVRVLTARNSPNGIQGLLQYFNLVEGCLGLIQAHQEQNNFTYDWIVRTRVDGYWSAPLDPENFVPFKYVVPPGSSYGGLNDRLGIGDFNTSTVALSRLSLIPKLDSVGFTQLNSETAFKAQLTTQRVSYLTKRIPFCIVTDRKYDFPPRRFGVPVAAVSSPGPLSGAKCRPCRPVCEGPCVADVMMSIYRGWSWTNWENGTLKLCNAHGDWEKGWEKIFDRAAGKKLAESRKRVWALKLKQCVKDLEDMKRRTTSWDAPDAADICRLGLEPK